MARRAHRGAPTAPTYGAGGVGGGRAHSLPRGVWVQRGRQLLPVLFVSRAIYRKRFDFFGIGQRTVAQRFPEEADKAIANALRTAR